MKNPETITIHGIKSVDQQTENQILVWIDNFGSVDFERIEESGTYG